MSSPDTVTVTISMAKARMLPDALWAVINAHDDDCEAPGGEGIDAIDDLALVIRNARIQAEKEATKC